MTWIQIIDDDHWAGEAIIALLVDVAGSARFEIRSEPGFDDGRDVYIVDNEFEDGDYGIELVRAIRERNPDATIILCTGTRDRIDLKTAMNAGCNALIEKGHADQRDELTSVIQRHLSTRAMSVNRRGVPTALSDIKSIIAAWNVRMAQESRSRAG